MEFTRTERDLVRAFNSYLEEPISDYAAKRLVGLVRDYLDANAKTIYKIKKIRVIEVPKKGLNVVHRSKILNEVLAHFDIDLQRLKLKSRQREVVFPRMCYFYFCRKYTYDSFKLIATSLNFCDHTTVIHSINTLTELIQTDPIIASEIEFLDQKLRDERPSVPVLQ